MKVAANDGIQTKDRKKPKRGRNRGRREEKKKGGEEMKLKKAGIRKEKGQEMKDKRGA